MKHHRILLLSSVVVALLVGGCGLWVWQAKQQYALNRELIAALVHNDTKQALVLVNAGADPNTRYATPPAPTLELLLNQLLRQSSLSQEDSPTAFLLACGAAAKLLEGGIRGQKHRPDNLELVQAMLAHGAIQHPHTAGDYIALHSAAMYNRVRVVELLLKRGASVNEQDNVGLTPLMGAVGLKHREMESLLLKHGADVNLADKAGETPLHFAINPDSDVEIIRQLLIHGADPTRPDKDGETPFDEAATYKRPDIVALLHKGAKQQAAGQ